MFCFSRFASGTELAFQQLGSPIFFQQNLFPFSSHPFLALHPLILFLCNQFLNSSATASASSASATAASARLSSASLPAFFIVLVDELLLIRLHQTLNGQARSIFLPLTLHSPGFFVPSKTGRLRLDFSLKAACRLTSPRQALLSDGQACPSELADSQLSAAQLATCKPKSLSQLLRH